jgi:hypothetical protein
LGVGVSVKATLHPAHSPVFKGLPEDFHALGVGVEEVSSYSMFFEGERLIRSEP